jgi:hypothetical protein
MLLRQSSCSRPASRWWPVGGGAPRARRAAKHLTLICRVDKTHHSKKYDIKAFMEAEFKRRNLFKKAGAE